MLKGEMNVNKFVHIPRNVVGQLREGNDDGIAIVVIIIAVDYLDGIREVNGERYLVKTTVTEDASCTFHLVVETVSIASSGTNLKFNIYISASDFVLIESSKEIVAEVKLKLESVALDLFKVDYHVVYCRHIGCKITKKSRNSKVFLMKKLKKPPIFLLFLKIQLLIVGLKAVLLMIPPCTRGRRNHLFLFQGEWQNYCLE